MYTISKAPHLILRAPRGHLFCRTTTFSWCNDTIARENVASILQRTFRGEKHFFQANEGKVIPFTVVITPLIYSWLNPTKWIFSCFRVVSTSITSTSYKSLSVLHFRSTFSIFFLEGAGSGMQLTSAYKILPMDAGADEAGRALFIKNGKIHSRKTSKVLTVKALL